MPDDPAATPPPVRPEEPEGGAAGVSKDRLGPDVLHEVRDLTEETAEKLMKALEDSRPVRAIRTSHIATAVADTVGFGLFGAGIEIAAADIPVLDNGWGAMAAGLILLAAAGVLLRRFME